ncbi:hypothetical protein Riv7116_6233 [Rivularia sp. PCC 7116]|uniref:hypothetical protein n=1 Tax=Rivularia sp. PCC 7116 TaxID=373994 RepID=UPI00029F3F51|nr:hypothetical protein [Rivularia sp. PCC 7116]AFY58582.1 hypothetical protein Riv7116_6233 [Rivularia sp. PCC 7116]
MKSSVKPRNILKLLTLVTVIGTTLGTSSSLNRNVYAFEKSPIDSSSKPIAANSGITSQAETVMANATAQNLKNQARQQLQNECTSVSSEALNSRKLTEFLAKYALGDEALQINSSIDINRMKNTQILDAKSLANDDSEAALTDKIKLICCFCGSGVCCPCI